MNCASRIGRVQGTVQTQQVCTQTTQKVEQFRCCSGRQFKTRNHKSCEIQIYTLEIHPYGAANARKRADRSEKLVESLTVKSEVLRIFQRTVRRSDINANIHLRQSANRVFVASAVDFFIIRHRSD